MTKVLDEADVIRTMREEWDKRVSGLNEEVEIAMKSKVGADGEKMIISPELKVRHKKSQLRYTVSSVGPRDVILRTPEEEEFLVDASELEKEYELD